MFVSTQINVRMDECRCFTTRGGTPTSMSLRVAGEVRTVAYGS